MPCYVCHEYGFFLLTVRKCASQSVKAWKRMVPVDIDAARFSECRRHRGYVRAAIVRNPYDRIISSWGRAKCTYAPHTPGKYGTFTRDIWGVERRHLENFVLELQRVQDPHWAPQCRWLCDRRGRLIPDYLIRMEDLPAGWSAFCRFVGIPEVPLPRRNNHDGNPHPLKRRLYEDYREYFTPTARRVAETVYADDLERLGYEF